jgi:cell division protein FtsI/penicillin-binding protein 2
LFHHARAPAIDVNWDEGTITVKESKEIISIDEAVRRKYIDGQTAQTLSMVVGKIHDVETRKPKVMMQSQLSDFHSSVVISDL